MALYYCKVLFQINFKYLQTVTGQMYYSYTKHTLFGLLIGVLAISILLYCLWSTITGGLGG